VVSVPSTRPPNWSPRIGLATEPVAMMTLPASISVPSNWPPILTLPSSVTEPWPSIRSILFFLNRPETPPVRVLMTLSRCLATPPMSTFVPSTLMPKPFAWLTSESTSAARRTALAGMHA
jgi:hypothetical protein